MECEVIVVGGGIGGLTAGALLAARGVDVVLLERQSHVGGCVANFEHLGHSFDRTFGLFTGWEPDGVWERVFEALPVTPPKTTKLAPNFVVRLPDGADIPVSSDREALQESLARAFPDCGDKAARFIRAILNSDAALGSLTNTSTSFRAFIDAQLLFLAQRTLDGAEPSRVGDALRMAMGDMWEIEGGSHTLADCLASSFKQSGGYLRLNSPVLRLAYGSDGKPKGVDLLSGERVTASRAIVSNLTVWDTYGKLVGLRNTPAAISAQLKRASAWGVYQVFILIDEPAVATLPSRRMIFASSAQETSSAAHMFLHIQSPNDQTQSAGKRCATVSELTDVGDWFAFHEDTSWHEEQDQAMLENIWGRLHAAAPAVTDGGEVFETATPQTAYESVRRKMGMIGAPNPGLSQSSTHLDQLFLVGDTAAQTIGLAGVAEAAHRLACSVTD